VRDRYQLPTRYFLYSGAVYPPKNFTRLVQAYAKVGPSRGISLVIAGGENRFLSEHELQEPARLGLGEWVKWCGWIDTQTLPAFYQMAEALLLPSLFESLGLPILEAMASGCPVVTSDRYGTKEIAQDAAVLVDPESVDAIAEGMLSVLDNAALRGRLIQAGLQRSVTFTWERCAAEILKVLTQCV
jgi:glycosyltransferase involved in cell wall biosynthesis